MAAEPTVLLVSNGLLSKWGFNDGDTPEAWLDWCEEQGIDWREFSWREGILPELVRRYLIPRLGHDVKLTLISTSHNPIRAETVDGTDVTGQWSGDQVETMQFTPEYVEVTMEQVLEVARGLAGPVGEQPEGQQR